jgi:hypothetical protein
VTGARWPPLRIDFGCETTSPRLVRHALAVHLPAIPVRADVLLVASELVANVVQHTQGQGTLELQAGPPIHIEVYDSDPTRPEPRHPGLDGGFGLGVVSALSDRWGTQDTPTGKFVWADFGVGDGR